jgi:YYY domain-containing protein
MEKTLTYKTWQKIEKHKYVIMCILIIILAAVLRYSGYNWDGLYNIHPDERAIGFAGDRIDFLKLKLDPEFYAYGSLPIYLTKIISNFLTLFDNIWQDFSYYILIGRLISATAGTLSVFIVFLIGKKLYDTKTGLLASLFLALTVSHIQDSHFATVDILLSFFIILSIYLMIDIYNGKATYRNYLAVSISIGLALAVKISASPLLVVFFFCHGINLYRNNEHYNYKKWLSFGLYVLLIIAVNFLAQPYAYIHFNQFLERVHSELRIAKTGDICYDQQYIHTPFLIYHLKELIYRSMGPPLGILAVISFALSIIFSIKNPKESRHILLLMWALPYFITINTYTVKYIRYMEPLFPILCLFSAYYLIKLIRYLSTSRAKKILAGSICFIVIGYTLFYSLAFFSIYMRPHTFIVGSKWVYNNIPEGKTILSQHWDEGFPLHIKGKSPQSYTIIELELYEHFGSKTEDRKKSEYLAKNLKKGDYIILQTRRLYGAVSNVKEKYPITTKYFDLLFTNRLGFKLIKEFNSYPTLLGITINDDLSDESFSVYDHPKILIFKKTQQFSEEEYIEMLEDYNKYTLSKEDMLSIHKEEAFKLPEYTITDELIIICFWLILLEAFGLIGFCLTYYLIKKSNGAIIFYSHITGILLFCYIIWILNNLKIINYTSIYIIAFFILALIASIAYIYNRLYAFKEILITNLDTIVLSKLMFAGCFVTFLIIRAQSPEIFWGEKPMDFGILNNLVLINNLPPEEIWYAGNPLNYYYFGQFIYATLTKLSMIPSYFTYNLSLATIGALGFTCTAGIVYLFTKNHLWGLLAGITTMFAGNLSGIRELIYGNEPINFHFFWATSRVIPKTINEYPLWGIIFGDLHAHLIALPLYLLVMFLGIFIAKLYIEKEKLPISLLFALSLSIGTVSVTNSWDYPGLCILLFVITTVALHLKITSNNEKLTNTLNTTKYILLNAFKYYGTLIAIVASSFLWFLPYWLTSKSASVLRFGIINDDEFIRINDYLTLWGLFLFIITSYFIYEIYRHTNTYVFKNNIKTSLFIISTIGLSAIIIHYTSIYSDFGTTALTAILFFTGLSAYFIATTPVRKIFISLATLGILITLLTNIFFMIDHMNTIFKFFLECWYLFTISSVYLLYCIVTDQSKHFKSKQKLKTKVLLGTWIITLVILILLSAFTSITAIAGFTKSKHVRDYKPVNTINGIKYLKYQNPNEYQAIIWIRKNLKERAIMLEAQLQENSAYNNYGRIVMNTGIPALVGWEHHLKQRAIKPDDIEKRYNDVVTIYKTKDINKAYSLLNKYKVDYIYAGWLEVEEFGTAGLKKFERAKDKFELIYSNPRVKIYKVL